MQTDNDLERRLRDVLRQELERDHGPDPSWDESPAARRVAEPERRRPSRWTIRLLAIAALLVIGGSAALLLGQPDDSLALGPNGWIAYGMQPEFGGDQDIWFVSPEGHSQRVIGTDDDGVDELCPAFSPDGRYLAYGRVADDGREVLLMVGEVFADGHVDDQFSIEVGAGKPPPCPVWSPDGERIAFGVPLTSVMNPERGAEGSEVWIVSVADRAVTVLPDLLATDLEFSPDGSIVAIASGDTYDGNYGEALGDNRIRLYELASGTMRILEGTLGNAGSFTWSPDGTRIAYQAEGLRVIDLATEDVRDLSGPYGTLHGIGPVWSPDGESIVYQRCGGAVACGGEFHDVVLVWPDDLADDGTPREAIVPLVERSADGSEHQLAPYWVTWSPDGQYLLFTAWSDQVDPLLGVVSVASGGPADVLITAQDIVVNPVYLSGPFVPIQSWGRLPADGSLPTPDPEASASAPIPTSSPTPSAWVGLPAGPHVLLGASEGSVPITVTVSAPSWYGEPNAASLCRGATADTCAASLDGAQLVAFEGREYFVYGEACPWASTRPDTPATTLDELTSALVNQGSRAEERPPEDVTVGGYPGKSILLPMYPVDLTTCDEGQVAMFGLPGNDPARFTQNLDLLEEVWAVDVNGLIVVLDGLYYPYTPQEVVDELRAIIQSATFE